MLSRILIRKKPNKKRSRDIRKEVVTGSMTLPFVSHQAMAKLNKPQITLVEAGDKPMPRGLEKGVGKLLPEMPCTKWGMPLAEKTPPRKQAMYAIHSMVILFKQAF
jgi:hypothetical protein